MLFGLAGLHAFAEADNEFGGDNFGLPGPGVDWVAESGLGAYGFQVLYFQFVQSLRVLCPVQLYVAPGRGGVFVVSRPR